MITLRDSRLQLLVLMLFLTLVGFMFVYSAGSLQAVRLGRSDMYFLFKQLVSFGIGTMLLMLAYKLPLELYRRLVVLLYFITMLLLIAVFTQKALNGAHRWLNLPIFSFQPSELAKFTTIVYLAHYLDKKRESLNLFKKGFLPASIMIGFLAALILIEPDFGTTFLIMIVAFTMFLVGGISKKHIFAVMAFLLPIFLTSLFFGYRRGRLLMFLDPWADRFGVGYQLVQSLAAVGSGGIIGKGIGNSTQKLFFLPEAHTDFIYAIVAEEWGFIGAFIIVLAVVMFFRIAIKSALAHSSRYKKLLMVGASCLLFYQSIINIMVVLGLLPTKGITLPFVSYGGSAMIASMFLVGVLLRGMEELE
ncbi:putative lipid II flippase FtsW [Deferribacterales bacterium RsTz2092]|nr:putative lipid II flippase FtsW [Deferribacterales bacterium]